MIKEELIKNQFPNDEFLRSAVSQIVDKCTAELEEKISVLLSCKNCPENKGGFICQKEYEDKCLAQKIQYIKELQEEKAKLKRLIKTQDRKLRQQSKVCDEAINRVEILEKENAELKSIAEFQQSSNMSRHFENKKLKEGLAVGSTFNKALNSMNKNLEEERDRYRNMVFDKDEQLTKAKELLKRYVPYRQITDSKAYKDLAEETEQFLKDCEVEK